MEASASHRVSRRQGWAESSPDLALVLSLTLLGVLLRFHSLGEKSFWFDEVYPVHLVVHAPSLAELLSRLSTSYNISDPPLFYLLQSLVFTSMPSEWTARLVACISGGLAVPVFYCLARQFFGAAMSGVGTLLFALAPFHIHYSQEARAYSLFALLSLISFLLLVRGARDPRALWNWVGYGVSALLCLYTHYFAVFMLACQAGVLGLLAGHPRPCGGLDAGVPAPRRTWVSWLAATGAASTLFGVSWLPALLRQREMADYLDIDAGPLGVGRFLEICQQVFAPGPYGAAIVVVVAVGAAICAARDASWRPLILACLWWIAFPIVGEYLYVTLAAKSFFHPRYVIYVLPPFILLFLAATTHIADVLRRSTGRSSAALASTAAAALVLVSYGWRLHAYYGTDKVPWRAVAALIKRHGSDGDIVAVEPGFHLPPLLHYLGVQNLLAYDATVLSDTNGRVHLGPLNALEDFDREMAKRGVWCVTSPDYEQGCASRDFGRFETVEGVQWPVIVYANDRVHGRRSDPY